MLKRVFLPVLFATTVLPASAVAQEAAREAVGLLRTGGESVSLLVMKTLLPVPPRIYELLAAYRHVVVVEENIVGLLRELLYGNHQHDRIHGVNKIGHMITPQEIAEGVRQCRKPS